MNEIKFTLSASSSSEPGVEIPTETPDYIKEIASKRKLNSFINSSLVIRLICNFDTLTKVKLKVWEYF